MLAPSPPQGVLTQCHETPFHSVWRGAVFVVRERLVHLIQFIGSRRGNTTGYGVMTRALSEALLTLQGTPFRWLMTEATDPAECAAHAALCRAHGGPVSHVALQVGPGLPWLQDLPGQRIAFTMFETDVLPDGWVAGLRRADKVFTPSAWGRQVMVDNGLAPERVFVVPGGVDGRRFHPWGGRLGSLQAPVFRFLIVGAYQTRKGHDEVLDAFAAQFRGRADVALLVKGNSFADLKIEAHLRTRVQALGLDNVQLVGGQLDDLHLAALYRSCDAFVMPSRGEGWCLPLIEALACGTPVIATCCSGHAAILEPLRGRFREVATRREAVTAPDFLRWYRFSRGAGHWYAPDPQDLAAALAEAVAAGRGRRHDELALEVLQRGSWAHAARCFVRAVLAPVPALPRAGSA